MSHFDGQLFTCAAFHNSQISHDYYQVGYLIASYSQVGVFIFTTESLWSAVIHKWGVPDYQKLGSHCNYSQVGCCIQCLSIVN